MSTLREGGTGSGIAAGTTTTINVAGAFNGLAEKVVVELAGAATSGTMDVSAAFFSGDFYSMGTIDFSANVPVEIATPGISQIKLTPTTVDDTYDYYVYGKDL